MGAQGHVTCAGGVERNWPRSTPRLRPSGRSGQRGFLGHRGCPGGQSGFLRAGWLEQPRASGWRHGQDWLPVPWASPPGCSRRRPPQSPLGLFFNTLSHVGRVECQPGDSGACCIHRLARAVGGVPTPWLTVWAGQEAEAAVGTQLCDLLAVRPWAESHPSLGWSRLSFRCRDNKSSVNEEVGC